MLCDGRIFLFLRKRSMFIIPCKEYKTETETVKKQKLLLQLQKVPAPFVRFRFRMNYLSLLHYTGQMAKDIF